MSFWKTRPRPLLILAPMSGYTESPFRRLIKDIEPTTILVSELISAEGLRRKNEKSLRLASFHPDEKDHYCVQLFGSDEQTFIDAAKVVEGIGADGIDLNFGCPSPKVVGSGHGSALLKDSCRSAKMIEKLVQSTSLPVSVKMRLGFYNDDDFIQNAIDFANAGIQCIAIHGRTTAQKYRGNADWSKIYALKTAFIERGIDIPVIGNGDVTSAMIGQNKLQNLDGIMIGRASMRNPWVFAQCRALFDGRDMPQKPKLPQQLDFFRKHALLAIDFKNEEWAMIELRKHFSHFVRGVRYASTFRDRLIRVGSYVEMEEIFDQMLRIYNGEEIPF